ncbi:MAG: very short patch repair endonuclease [Verrucomicrobiota bacterium]
MKRGLDKLTKEHRSWNMSRIRGMDTKPEVAVRQHLHRMGFRFRLHVKIPIEGRAKLPLRRDSEAAQQRRPTRVRFVRPDIVLPRYKTAIFVHGCFWHRHKGCKNCTTPTHRQEFWLAKLNGNAARDKLHQRALRKLGWRVIVVWECRASDAIPRIINRLNKTSRVKDMKAVKLRDDAHALSNR